MMPHTAKTAGLIAYFVRRGLTIYIYTSQRRIRNPKKRFFFTHRKKKTSFFTRGRTTDESERDDGL
jgi:hypothetical protein